MPYSSNSDLPESVRSRYSSHCQSVWRNVWNSVYDRTKNESRAFASANSQAQKCEGKKSMNEPMFKIFAPLLKASLGADGKMRLHGVASSTVRDKHGDVMTLSALNDMEKAAANNMTIFLNHEYKVPEDVAGSVERAVIRSQPAEPDVHDLVLDIVINANNQRAKDAWQAINDGTQLGLSIGARIPKDGAKRDRDGVYIIEHVDLLETSLVGVPANPRSWVEYAVKSLNAAEPEPEPEPPVEVTEAALSSESRNALPDSAFACPAKRKYPHHTASGAVDRSHLKNGLARCGDSSNDQCGCAHLKAHAKKLGIGEASEKSFEDLLVLALEDGIDESHFTEESEEGPTFEWDWDAPDEIEESLDVEKGKKPASHEHPHAHGHGHEHSHWSGIVHSHDHHHTHSHAHEDGHEHVDDMQGAEHDHDHSGSWDNDHAHDTAKSEDPTLTGDDLAAHEAEFDSANKPPETPSQDASSSTPENEDVEEEVTSALQILEPTVVASLHSTSQILAALTRELSDARTALEEARSERDAALEAAKQALTGTSEILAKLSETPVGRRSVVREASDKLVSLSAVYSDDFIRILKKES